MKMFQQLRGLILILAAATVGCGGDPTAGVPVSTAPARNSVPTPSPETAPEPPPDVAPKTPVKVVLPRRPATPAELDRLIAGGGRAIFSTNAGIISSSAHCEIELFPGGEARINSEGYGVSRRKGRYRIDSAGRIELLVEDAKPAQCDWSATINRSYSLMMKNQHRSTMSPTD